MKTTHSYLDREGHAVTINAGDGATLAIGSDAKPYTVVGFSESGSTVYVRRDNYKRVDDRGYYTESQDYEYTPDPEAPVQKAHLSRKRGCYRLNGLPLWLGHRRAYRDPSF